VCFKFPISSIKENHFFLLLESPKLGKIKQNFEMGGNCHKNNSVKQTKPSIGETNAQKQQQQQ